MENQGSVISRASQYFSESAEELKKISAPSREDAVRATLVTLALVGFVSVVVALMDIVFRRLMEALVVG